ncbi:MAG TPA: hypothetical protein VGQ83_24035 [Polyangia bacterium]|jgi:hypothetical protein
MLQNTAADPSCQTAHMTDSADRFLRFNLARDGTAVAGNFVGSVDAVFDCYRAVGVNGCGFEHVLGAVRTAVEGCATPGGCAQPANEGFLRPDAYLAAVIFTDEDDCTAPPDSAVFDPTQTSLMSELGPLTSYRCFEFGITCGGADVGRTAGPRTDCAQGSKDPNPKHQLVPVEALADALKAVKPQSPRMVYAAVFGGAPAPVAVGLDSQGYPDLQPSCRGSTSGLTYRGSADPGMRRLVRFRRPRRSPREVREPVRRGPRELHADLRPGPAGRDGAARHDAGAAPQPDVSLVAAPRLSPDREARERHHRDVPRGIVLVLVVAGAVGLDHWASADEPAELNAGRRDRVLEADPRRELDDRAGVRAEDEARIQPEAQPDRPSEARRPLAREADREVPDVFLGPIVEGELEAA